jgi:outer membrane protein OmpA-like peptidoglycan-associated protein
MKKIYLFLFFCFALKVGAQMEVIGHNLLNNKAIANTKVFVKCDGVITQTLNTKTKTEFRIELDYGKNYKVYLQNEKSPLIFFEVITDNIPQNKYDYAMGHIFNALFVDKTDGDIDTTVFKNAFYKIIYDGKKHMIDDTAYNNAFAATILKKKIKTETTQNTSATEAAVTLAGKVYLNRSAGLTVKNQPIYCLNKTGDVIKSTSTNRFGAFVFTGVLASEVVKIKMDIKQALVINTALNLFNTKDENIVSAMPNTGYCEWMLNQKEVASLIDNNFTTNIGGKLVVSSAKEKKFFAEKTVYLTNKLNTVIKKTKTNLFGTFVFENIEPDHEYLIGVDMEDVSLGQKIDLLSKDDAYIGTLDSSVAKRKALKFNSNYNAFFNDVSIEDDEMKMDIKASIFGDNVNHPIGKLKIILLNDNYEPIDSAVTNDFGSFKFKYLPFLKRFYLSAENTDNILDMFQNILIYSNDDNLVKIMTHQKGKKFTYNPVNAEISRLRDIELEDPWLELMDKKPNANKTSPAKKLIIENILFETNKYAVTAQAKEVLDKIILVLNANKQLEIEIGAHTDSKGTDADNMKLSQLRGKSVQHYITSAGIDVKRITSIGYGETKLLNNCKDNIPCSDIEHAQNRRIEFKILGE